MFLRKRGESRILTNGHLHSIVKLQALNLHHVLEISIIASQNEGDTGLYTDISGADSVQMVYERGYFSVPSYSCASSSGLIS